MKHVSRRDFIHAGCAVAAACLPGSASAWFHGSPVVVAPVELTFIFYGQSNMGGMFSAAASPPAASANTSFYDPTTGWGSVPGANGIREFMNAMVAATGVPCRAINGSVGGVPIEALLDESPGGLLDLFYDQMAAAGVTDADMCLFHQGEGNTNTVGPTSEATYKTAISDLHSKLATHLGLTKSQLPFVQASLTTYGGSPGANTDDTWSTIRTAQFRAAQEQPNVWFSHSNMDAVRTDVYHFDGASQGRAGKRYAQTAKFILGLGGGPAHFEITGATVVSDTVTRCTITHTNGATDFTPTTGITGAEASGDNGGSWVAATGARVNGTTIDFTHSSLVTTSQRKFRYQFGMAPDVSAPLKDNSTLALPLTFTPDIISPTPLSILPIPTPRGSVTLTGSGQIQTATSIPIGASTPSRYLMFSKVGGGNSAGTVLTVTPNIGSAVIATLIRNQGNIKIFGALLPSDADDAVTVDVSIDYQGNPFNNTLFYTWSVPSGDVASTTPTGSNGSTTAAATVGSATVATTDGGFMIVAARSSNASSNTAVISGTETFAERVDFSAGLQQTVADASDVATDAANAVSVTYTQSGTIDLALAAWR